MFNVDGSPKQAATDDQFEFSAVFEVYPEISLGDISGAKITRPVAEVTPADVEHTLEILRKQARSRKIEY